MLQTTTNQLRRTVCIRASFTIYDTLEAQRKFWLLATCVIWKLEESRWWSNIWVNSIPISHFQLSGSNQDGLIVGSRCHKNLNEAKRTHKCAMNSCPEWRPKWPSCIGIPRHKTGEAILSVCKHHTLSCIYKRALKSSPGPCHWNQYAFPGCSCPASDFPTGKTLIM